MVNKDLIKGLVNCVIKELDSKEKREAGNIIIELMGGTSKTQVSKLPARRGVADGGLDGRVNVIAPKIVKRTEPDRGVWFERGEPVVQEAGVSIKLEKKKFSRGQFGAFKDDLEREGLSVGIIISASGLSPDAERRIRDTNAEGVYQFVYIGMGDLISGSVNTDPVQLECGNISEQVYQNLNKMLNQDSV